MGLLTRLLTWQSSSRGPRSHSSHRAASPHCGACQRAVWPGGAPLRHRGAQEYATSHRTPPWLHSQPASNSSPTSGPLYPSSALRDPVPTSMPREMPLGLSTRQGPGERARGERPGISKDRGGVSCSCRNGPPQTGQLRQQSLLSPSWGLQSAVKVTARPLPLEAAREDLPCVSLASGGCWPPGCPLACRPITPHLRLPARSPCV